MDSSSVRSLLVKGCAAAGVVRLAGALVDAGDADHNRIALAAGAAIALIHTAYNTISPLPNQSWSERFGELLLHIPFVQHKFAEDIGKRYAEFQQSVRDQWERFGEPIVRLPDEGWSQQRLESLVDHYAAFVNAAVNQQEFSGAIYSPSLRGPQPINHQSPTAVPPAGQSLAERAASVLNRVLPYGYQQSHLWNMLHSKEFAVGYFIEHQVVRIVAELLGEPGDQVAGFVTSGGTESLMQAMYAYRQWGREKRNHRQGESVIIIPDTIHAALDKGAKKLDIELVRVPTGPDGVLEAGLIQKALATYGNRVVAVFASAPSFPTGAVDPIQEIGEMCAEAKCGFHVDVCLGAFIVNLVGNEDSPLRNILRLKGVTSSSGDTHKFGLGSKGSSVLIGRTDVSQDVTYYSAFSALKTRIGLYGSPRDPGSQPVTPALNTLLALLAMGKNGYRETAERVIELSQQVVQRLREKFDGRIRILGPAEHHVIGLTIDPKMNFQKNATYALTHELEKLGITLNNITGDAAHLCVTPRMLNPVDSEPFVDKLEHALERALDRVAATDARVKAGEAAFPGDAGLYGTLTQMTQPSLEDQGWAKYLENVLFGQRGLDEAMRHYFRAHLNPHASAHV